MLLFWWSSALFLLWCWSAGKHVKQAVNWQCVYFVLHMCWNGCLLGDQWVGQPLVCQSIYFFYNSSISCPNNIALAIYPVVTGSSSWCFVCTYFCPIFSSPILWLVSFSSSAIMWSWLLILSVPLSVLLIIVVALCCFSICVRMFSSGSVFFMFL